MPAERGQASGCALPASTWFPAPDGSDAGLRPPELNRCPWGQLLLDDGVPVGNFSAAPPMLCADRVGTVQLTGLRLNA